MDHFELGGLVAPRVAPIIFPDWLLLSTIGLRQVSGLARIVLLNSFKLGKIGSLWPALSPVGIILE
jgi:hypothetical protein